MTRNPLKSIHLPETIKLRSLTLNTCLINDDIFKGIELPYIKELFLIRNQMRSLGAFTVQGAFTSLRKLFIEENFVQRIPFFNLPELTDLSMLANPIVDISGFLQSYIPSIKFIYLGKKKKVGGRKKFSK